MRPRDRITHNFSTWEITCRCGCGLNAVDMDIMGRVQMLRDMYGVPITVLSGCRCIFQNRVAEGRDGSYHLPGIWRQTPGMFCQAIDWTIQDKKLLGEIDDFWEPRWSGGWHFYQERGFIHSDCRGETARW